MLIVEKCIIAFNKNYNMTDQEIFDQCDGYMTVSDDRYKEKYVYKEKDGQILYPFYKFWIRKESGWPSCVYIMYIRRK